MYGDIGVVLALVDGMRDHESNFAGVFWRVHQRLPCTFGKSGLLLHWVQEILSV